MHILVSFASRWRDLSLPERDWACERPHDSRDSIGSNDMSDLPILDAHAAFVDVGSEQMHVSVAGGPPQVFATFTAQLHALRDWLKAQGVRSVAMEATGVYWLPLYGVLEAARF